MAYQRKIRGKFYLKCGVVIEELITVDGESIATIIEYYQVTLQRGFEGWGGKMFCFGDTTFNIQDISAATFINASIYSD